MTKTQKAIFNAVAQSGRHLSAEDVYWIVKQTFPSIALGTVYRNLNRFAASGQLRRVARADAADYFEGNVVPHDHTLCIHCGEMADLKIDDLKDFLEGRMRRSIVSFDLTVHYTCPKCAQTTTNNVEKNGDAAQYPIKTDQAD